MKAVLWILFLVTAALGVTGYLLQEQVIDKQTNELWESKVDLFVADQTQCILQDFATKYYDSFEENIELRRKLSLEKPTENRTITNDQAALLNQELRNPPKTKIVIYCWPSAPSLPRGNVSEPATFTPHLLPSVILYSTVDTHVYPNNTPLSISDGEFLTRRLYTILSKCGFEVAVVSEVLPSGSIHGLSLAPNGESADRIALMIRDSAIASGITDVQIQADQLIAKDNALRIDVGENRSK
jgi:hypothetical protein